MPKKPNAPIGSKDSTPRSEQTSPQWQRLDRNTRRVAVEYLKDGDIEAAMLRAGYWAQDAAREGERGRKMLSSHRFHQEVEWAIRRLQFQTYHRQAGEEKGQTAQAAVERLADLARPPISADADEPADEPEKGW